MSTTTEQDKKARRWPSLSTQVILGLAIGIVVGILFGEYCSDLKVSGQAFIYLLQMTVLPYVIVALVLQIGRLSWREL